MPALFVNPFKKHDVSEFEGVFVPLRDSNRQGSVATTSTKEKDSEKKSDLESGDGSPPPTYSANTIEGLRAEVEGDLAAGDGAQSSTYDRKSKIINKAIQDIGMGRYQWELFVLCGYGWLADNLWLQGVALTIPSFQREFGVSENNVRYTTCALFIGLCLGASIWGVASDVIGRRIAFNATLFIAGVFGLAVGGAPNWIAACGMYAALGTGIGGNLPVDGALFLEFLPMASGNLLTMLSVWWPVGQLVSSLLAWALIPNFSCAETGPCTRADNMGWRYFNFTLGGITMVMFISRFFLFHLYESPKFLLSRGRQAEAVATVHGIAHKNGKTTWLSEDILNEIGGMNEVASTEGKLSTMAIIKGTLGKFSTQRIGPLFSTRQLGLMTALIWWCWLTIGMGYPLFNAFLPQYLSRSGGDQPTDTQTVYRNYAITSVVGVPGSILACYTVDIKHVGRKGTICVATLLTGIWVFLFTIKSDPNYQVAMSSLEAFFQNIMYGVLYAYTPEVFPAPNRGTGTGIGSFFNRIGGLCAPIIAANSGASSPNVPIYVSGGLILAAFFAMLGFPIETRGKQSL